MCMSDTSGVYYNCARSTFLLFFFYFVCRFLSKTFLEVFFPSSVASRRPFETGRTAVRSEFPRRPATGGSPAASRGPRSRPRRTGSRTELHRCSAGVRFTNRTNNNNNNIILPWLYRIKCGERTRGNRPGRRSLARVRVAPNTDGDSRACDRAGAETGRQ